MTYGYQAMRVIDRLLQPLARAVHKAGDVYYKTEDPGATLLFGPGDKTSLDNPYTQLPIVAAAVNAAASRMARVPWDLYKPGSEKPVGGHALGKLLSHPTGVDTWEQFIRLLAIRVRLDGEWLVELSEESIHGIPANMTLWAAEDYEPWIERGIWAGWRIKRTRRTIAHQDCLFYRFPNPNSRYRGLSPMDALRVSNESDFSARRYNKRFFDNDASPGNHWHFSRNLNEREKRSIANYLDDSRRGAEKSHGTVITSGGDVTHTGMGASHRDAQFVELFGLTLHDVCAALNVDPAIIGFEKESKYASAKEARRYFWTDVIIPELTAYAGVFNRLCSRAGLEIRFDFTGIEALQADMVQKVAVAEALGRLGWTPNQINDRLELGMDPAPNGDVPLPSAQPFMLAQKPEATKEMVVSPKIAEGPVAIADEWHSKEHRAAIWKDATSGITGIRSKLTARLRAYWHKVQKQLLRVLDEDGVEGLTEELEKGFDGAKVKRITAADIIDVVFDFLVSGAKVGYTQVMGGSDELPEELINAIRGRGGKLREVAEHAQSEIRDKVQDAVRRSAEEGLSQVQTTEAVRESLRGAISNLNSRAKTIAHTEVHSAYAEARHTGIEDSGATARMWITSRNDNVRDSHAMMDGQTAQGDGRFSNGLMHPLDPDGPAEEVINCHCIEIPIYQGQNPEDMS